MDKLVLTDVHAILHYIKNTRSADCGTGIFNLLIINKLYYKIASARFSAMRSFSLRQLGPIRRFKPLSTT